MRKALLHIILIFALFVSCEEYYKPDLDVGPGILVVESHVTNDPNQNYARLSLSDNFYNTEPRDKIYGAKVDLIEVGGQTTNGVERTPGYFTFARTPVAGKKYVLRIAYQKNIYQSEQVIMPPLPSIDSLYTTHTVEKSYRTNVYGNPEQVLTPGREIKINAPITKSLEYYRFTWRAIIQWHYDPPALAGPPPPPYFGWISKYDREIFNLAGPKEFSLSNKVTNHRLLMLAYDSRQHLDSLTQIPDGWILIVDQYGIQEASHNFHQKLNQQFTAEGSLFDPILSQAEGNMHCVNDATKPVLGFFDLNSYRQYRFYLHLGNGEKGVVKQRRINQYYEIPGQGYLRGIRPPFWEGYN